MKPDISIVIPAYNESERLEAPLRTLIEYVKTSDIAIELIVVDDGSSDDTADVANRAFAANLDVSSNVIRYDENRGKGYAIKIGLLAAGADIALFTDADLSTPIDQMPKLTDPIKSGEFDLTFGSRVRAWRRYSSTRQPQ